MTPHYEVGRKPGSTIALSSSGDQLYIAPVAHFVLVLYQPRGDSSTSYDLSPAEARELAAALTDAARSAEEGAQ